jgi:two-component system response regulator FixJ
MVVSGGHRYWLQGAPSASFAEGFIDSMSTARNLPMRDTPLVYLADPDVAVQRSIKTLLSALGARVESYSSAHDLLARLPTAIPTCIIAEARLPDLSGLALMQELRARGLAIPVILLSSDADVTSAVTAMRAGALDFIEKPYIDRALVAQVTPLLDLDEQRAH